MPISRRDFCGLLGATMLAPAEILREHRYPAALPAPPPSKRAGVTAGALRIHAKRPLPTWQPEGLRGREPGA
jgi:hypothetical protein